MKTASKNVNTTRKALDVIQKQLVKRNETLSVAESVTAGNLQATLSLAKNATEFFQGGLTLYNTGQKSRHLHIDPITAERTNCVSDKIAQLMATGACSFFSSDWGIAITGYAAPVPQWKVSSVLFAWYALSYKGSVVAVERIETKKMAMDKVQVFYVRTILKHFAKMLLDFNGR